MDFLDPRKKIARRKRLIVSYALMALVVVSGTAVVILSSLGYGVNTKTGKVVQNGLVFVNSTPAGAKIFVNGKDTQKMTSSRLILSGSTRLIFPSGDYTLSLQEDGYRQWQRSFSLKPQSILRLDYPILVPILLKPKAVANFASQPVLTTLSDDRRWLVQGFATRSGLSLTQYDLNIATPVGKPLTMPANLLGLNGGRWQVIDWSSDGTTVLLKQTLGARSEFIALNRSSPTKSFNVTQDIDFTASQVKMRDNKSDQFYILASDNRLFSLTTGSAPTLMFKDILAFEPLGDSRLLFIVGKKSAPTQAIKLWDGSKAYGLGKINNSGNYLLAASNFAGHEYYLATLPESKRIDIYSDPLNSLRAGVSPKVTIRLPGLASAQTSVSSSPKSRFLAIQSGQSILTYDFQKNESFAYKLPKTPAGPLTWMDNYHLSGLVDGKAYMTDYDGINQYSLSASSIPGGVWFASSLDYLLTQTNHSKGSTLFMIPLGI